MQRIPVESTDIASVGYDPKERVLEVEFHGDRTYRYKDVEPDIHQQFMRAESFGHFFSSFIDRRYRYERVETGGQKETFPESVAYVTGSSRKARDLQLACNPFGIFIEQLEVPIDEIQSSEAADIALKKAKAAHKLAGRPVVVNDSFWNILSLRGFPGAYMSEVAKWLSAGDWLKLMDGKPNRTVFCTDTLVYYDGKRSKSFVQDFSGKLATEARGDGSSIDQLLILDGQIQTVAEIEQQTGASSFDIETSNLYDFAKWFNMQRRLGRA
jgi:inosine/xanthosine triphosphate pyrophosphatase family protein